MQSDKAIFNTMVKCTVVTYELGSSTPRRNAGPSFFIQKTIDGIIYPDMLQQFAVTTCGGKDCTPSFSNRTALHLILVTTLCSFRTTYI